MSCKETIEMSAQIAITIAVIISCVALFFSNRTNKLQRESLQANMFNDITKRIDVLMDAIPTKSEKPTKREISVCRNWNLSLLNAFEHYSFFANHNYLRDEMVSYYKNYMIDFCNDLQNDCPEAVKYLKETKSEARYYELKKHYKNMTSKTCPI